MQHIDSSIKMAFVSSFIFVRYELIIDGLQRWMFSKMFLIINIGSTSIKTCVIRSDLKSLAILTADYSTNIGWVMQGQDFDSSVKHQQLATAFNTEAVFTTMLTEWQKMIADANITLSAIGHRIVHGGKHFHSITPITNELLSSIASLDGYAPLHNPLNRLGIELTGKVFVGIPQYAVFDTAFHHHIPEYVGRYAIPQNLSDKVEFYRYGFHGISCQHNLLAAAELLGQATTKLNLIVLHLGGGASATAIYQGVSVDTSIDFSPTEGLIMAERSGDLDPMILITLIKEGWSPERIEHLLNHESGLHGICGLSDMRSILAQAAQGNDAALLATDMYCYRIKKVIGAYCAVLGEVSAVIFTGGVGEHAPAIREIVLRGMDKLGFQIDPVANHLNAEHNRDISRSSSCSRILVIRAEEEQEIARQILEILNTVPETQQEAN